MSHSLLTSSRASAARACQRLHHIKYNLGYQPTEDADALRFGTLIHLGLEAWWRAANNKLEAAFDAMRSGKAADQFELIKAEEMLRGYDVRWLDGAERYETLGVEKKFETELRNPATGRPSQNWRLAGKIDVIVHDRQDGLQKIVEHKTASADISPGSDYWKRLRMDGQVSIYYEGARSLRHDIQGCIYDVLGKPAQKPLKATPVDKRKYTKKTGELYADQRESDETPEEFRIRVNEAIAKDPAGYFQRGDVVRLEKEMEEALHELWQLAQQLRESELAGRAPRNADACLRYGKPCPFFDVCSGSASLDDESRFRKSEIHPELIEQPKEKVA